MFCSSLEELAVVTTTTLLTSAYGEQPYRLKDIVYLIWPSTVNCGISSKVQSRHDADFIVTGGIGGCHNDNPGATSYDKVGIMTTLGFHWLILLTPPLMCESVTKKFSVFVKIWIKAAICLHHLVKKTCYNFTEQSVKDQLRRYRVKSSFSFGRHSYISP